MRRLSLVAILSLVVAFRAPAQDTSTLDGERAIRFLGGHGHISSYCDGQILITPTRLRFDGVTLPQHSFDFKRSEIKDLHYGSAFRFHYLKLQAGGKTYRLPIFPELHRELGDRFELFVRAYRDFDAAYTEVERVAAQRKPASVIKLHDEKDGPVLEFPVLVGLGVLWFTGPHGVTVWTGPEADKQEYAEMHISGGRSDTRVRVGAGLAYGTLEVTARHVRLYREGGDSIVIDDDRDQMRVKSGAGGYPEIVVNFRNTGRVSLLLGQPNGDGVKLYDAAPLVRALGPDFEQVVKEVQEGSR